MSCITESITKSVNTIIDGRLKNLKYDLTFKTVINQKNDDGTYEIIYRGQPYCVYSSIPQSCQSGQPVWVKIPNGSFNDMHICGIAR